MFRLSVAFISLVLLQSAFAAPVLLTTSNAAAAALSNRRGDIPPGRINGHSAREDLEDIPDLNIFDDRALLGDILGSSGSLLGPDGGADERKRREETPADLGSTVAELLSDNPAQGLGGSPQDARGTLAARQAGFWDNILNLVVDAPKDVEGPTSENPKKRQAVSPFTGTGVPQLDQPGGTNEDAAPQEQDERRRQLDLADGEALPADADLLRRQSGVLDPTDVADADSDSDLGHVTDEGGILDPVESLTTPGLGDDDDQDGDDDDDQDGGDDDDQDGGDDDDQDGGDDDDQDGGDDDDQDGGDDDEDSDDVTRQDDSDDDDQDGDAVARQDDDDDQDDDQDGDADTEARQVDDGRVEDPNSLANSADDLVSRSEGFRPPRPPVFAPASVPTPPSDSSV